MSHSGFRTWQHRTRERESLLDGLNYAAEAGWGEGLLPLNGDERNAVQAAQTDVSHNDRVCQE